MLLTKLATISLALLACSFVLRAAEAETKDDKADAPKKAVCVLSPTKGSTVQGVITFAQRDGAIEVAGEITGLTPGAHGFHVHEFGDCSSPDAMSTGGHFNPDKEKHGGPHDAMRHVGDLGNIQADASGKAVVHITDKLMQLSGPHSIIGRGLIVHAKADDLKTQPTGDAGGRVACGVIGVGK